MRDGARHRQDDRERPVVQRHPGPARRGNCQLRITEARNGQGPDRDHGREQRPQSIRTQTGPRPLAHQDGSAAYVVAYTHTGEVRLITKDDHLRRTWGRARRKAEIEGSILRAIIMALSTGPLNIVASLGPGPALIAGGIAGIVQVLVKPLRQQTDGGRWLLRVSPKWNWMKSKSGFIATPASSRSRSRQSSGRQQHSTNRR
jgi:hypothetical protein